VNEEVSRDMTDEAILSPDISILVFFSFSFYCVPCVRFHNKHISGFGSEGLDYWIECGAQVCVSHSVYPVEQNGSDCHFVLLDKDASCPTADLSNIGCPNGPAYLTGELLNTPQM